MNNPISEYFIYLYLYRSWLSENLARSVKIILSYCAIILLLIILITILKLNFLRYFYYIFSAMSILFLPFLFTTIGMTKKFLNRCAREKFDGK